MSQRRPLTEEDRIRIFAHYEDLKNYAAVARLVDRDESVVRKCIQGKTYGPGKKKCGRKPKLDDRDKRQIMRLASNECITSTRIKAELGLTCSKTTIVKALNECPFIKRRKLKKQPNLKPRHKAARLAWANERLRWDEEWKHCIFSDEKKFNLDGPDGYNYYWHDIRKEERHVLSRQQGGGSVMVWGAIGWAGRSRLIIVMSKINAHVYKQVLENGLMPVLTDIALPGVIYQHDNAKPHTAKSTKKWINDHRLNVMPWPSMSPDLNPIENCWGHMVRRIYADSKQYSSVAELEKAITEEWYNMPQSYIQSLISSMQERVQKTVNLKGSHIGH